MQGEISENRVRNDVNTPSLGDRAHSHTAVPPPGREGEGGVRSVLSPALHVVTARGHPNGHCWEALECTGLNPGALAGPTQSWLPPGTYSL